MQNIRQTGAVFENHLLTVGISTAAAGLFEEFAQR
jgi:hypothetical protein